MEPNRAIFHVTLRGFDITSVAFVTDIYIYRGIDAFGTKSGDHFARKVKKIRLS